MALACTPGIARGQMCRSAAAQGWLQNAKTLFKVPKGQFRRKACRLHSFGSPMIKHFLKFFYLAAVTIIAIAILQQPAEAGTTLLLRSIRPDTVGSGKTLQFDDTQGMFRYTKSTNGALFVDFTGSSLNQYWSILIFPPRNKTFARGEYENAQGAFYQSPVFPGLEVRRIGSYCERISGRFNISDIAVDAEGALMRLALDFEQYCGNAVSPLFGSLRYNSTVPISPRVSVGDAQALRGNAGTTDALAVVSLSMPATSPVTATIKTVASTAVAGVDFTSVSTTVRFAVGETSKTVIVPIIGTRQARELRRFSVNIVSASVPIGDRSGSITIRDPNSRLTAFLANSDPQNWLGAGTSWHETPASTLIRSMAHTYTLQHGALISTDLPHHWNLNFSGPNNTYLHVGDYLDAKEEPGHPSLNVSGNGRACYMPNGKFRVNEVTHTRALRFDRLSIDFEQHCGLKEDAFFGFVRVNAFLHEVSISNATIANGQAVFRISLNTASKKKEYITFETRDGSAKAGTDYTKVVRSVSFPPGVIDRHVSVPLLKPLASPLEFFGAIRSRKTPVWISTAPARN